MVSESYLTEMSVQNATQRLSCSSFYLHVDLHICFQIKYKISCALNKQVDTFNTYTEKKHGKEWKRNVQVSRYSFLETKREQV